MASVQPTSQNDAPDECSASSGGATKTTSTGQGGGVSRIVTACRAFFDSFTPPLGYEDETGFHYGSEPKSE